MAYDAFISYSHAADGDLAPALEAGLERLARPWYKLRALSVFRDQSDLSLTPHLWSTIATQLADSRFLVLLASPESAASVWVNKEVAHWCDTKGTDRLVLVVTGGEIGWDDAAHDFSATSTAVPEALRGRFAEEPLYQDLRWARGVPDLSLRLSRFRGAVAQVAATIRGVSPDDLEGEDVRLHRRARRLAKAAVSAVVALALLAAAAAVVAVGNARRADARAREAIARQVGLQALDEPTSGLDRALLLSLAASELDRGAGNERYRASRTLVGRYSRLETLLGTTGDQDGDALTSVRGLAFSADGATLAGSVLSYAPGGAMDGTVLRWDLAGDRRTAPSRATAPVGPVAFVGTGHAVLAGSVGTSAALVPDDATAPATPPPPAAGTIVAARPARARAIVSDASEDALVDLTSGRRLAALPREGEATALTDTVAVIASGGQLVVLDASTGAERARAPLPAKPATITAVTDAAGRGTVVTVATGPDQVELTRWTLGPGSLTQAGSPVPLTGSTPPTRAVLSPDGRTLLAAGRDGTALVDTTTGAIVATEPGSGNVVEVDPTGRFVALGGDRFAVWDLGTRQRVIALPDPVNAVAWSSTCSAAERCRLVTVGRSLDAWDPLDRSHIRVADDTNAQAVALSADGATIASAGWGPSVAIWRLQPRTDDAARATLADAGGPTAYDPASGAQASVTDGQLEVTASDGTPRRLAVGEVDRVALLAGGERALTVAPGRVVLWDTTTGNEVSLDALCRTDLVATSPDGRRVAGYRPDDRAVGVCDATTGRRVAASRLDAAVDPVEVLAVADDGGVAVGGADGVVARYARGGGRLQSGTAIDVRFGGERVTFTALALGTSRLAAGLAASDTGADAGEGGPGRVLVWDFGTDEEPIVFDADQRQVVAVALIGEGDGLLAVAGRDAPDGEVTVQISEAATRRRLGRALGGLTGDVTYLGGDDAAVVGVDGRGQAFRWEVDRDPRRDICTIVGRPLTRPEWDAASGGTLPRGDYAPQCP